MKKLLSFCSYAFFFFSFNLTPAQSQSVAREWNELVLYAISADFARPTIHARNLFHTSIAMYDSWAAYEQGANTYILGKTIGGYTSDFVGVPIPENADSAKEMAMSYAVYRIIEHRYSLSPGIVSISDSIETLMEDLGYDPFVQSTDYVNGGPAELGNYIAAQIIEFGFQDGSNEADNYANLYYEPLNPSIAVEEPGNPTIIDPNRWQQITLSESIDQSGEVVANTPDFLSPEWGDVLPFSMTDDDLTIQNRDGFDYRVYFDPGPPPFIDTTETICMESFYKWNFTIVPVWQSHLDVDDPTVWDISPASIGNIESYPEEDEEYANFYDYLEGGDPGTGYDINPVTGMAYTPQLIKRADYARVLAEFWADGPSSVTPPGHWFKIYNEVSDHELFDRSWTGVGTELDELEYDVRAYFALGGAMHDAAIAAWSIKGYYDYLRPVSAVRFMADKGQCSNPEADNFHNAGIPLIDGYIESVETGDPLAGANDEHLGKIKLYTWKGPDYIDDPETDQSGVGWILAENWWPYQRPSFVTPPFAGYVSGHSTYSRTAAELMELMTGSAFFPGGMSGFEVEQNEFLVFEEGPSESFELQWATYQDASDQCSLSRIWGGIHPPIDDIPGRKIGMNLGPQSFNYANQIIQEKKPYVVEFTADTDELNADFIGDELTIILEFDQEMDQTIMPEFSFAQQEVQDALTEIGSAWISPVQVEYSFALENVLIENVSTTVSVKSALSSSGEEQNPYLISNPFSLDTKKPELTGVDLTAAVVNDQIVEGGEFSIELSFSEPCSENENVTIELVAEDNLGNSLSLNLENSGWSDGQTYLAVYDLSDDNTEIAGIDVSVSMGEDLLGNQMDAAVATDIFEIDTKNPTVVDVSLSDDLLTIQDFGNGSFIVTIEFDEMMIEEETPELSFVDQNPLGTSLTYNPISSGWTSESSCEVHYLFELAQAEFLAVDVSLEDFRDINGNKPNEVVLPNLFSIDTKRPQVEFVSPQNPVVSDQNVADGQFWVDVEFSELMDVTQSALVLLDGDDIDNSLVIDFGSSSWLNDTTFRASFDVSDQNVEIQDIGIAVEFALDASGNSQNSFVAMDAIDVDTKNPELISFSSSDYIIDQSNVGSESFNFVLIFDEEMQITPSVDFVFSPQEPVSSIIQLNQGASQVLNPFTYQMVFDVIDSEESVPAVDVTVSEARDLAGNAMVSLLSENILSLELETLGLYDNPMDGNPLVYPNLIRSGNPVNIKLVTGASRLHFKIRNMQGKILQEKEFRDLLAGVYNVALSKFSTGIYVYELVLEDNFYTGKLIIH